MDLDVPILNIIENINSTPTLLIVFKIEDFHHLPQVLVATMNEITFLMDKMWV